MRMLDMRLCNFAFSWESLQPAGMPEMRINDDKSLKQATKQGDLQCQVEIEQDRPERAR